MGGLGSGSHYHWWRSDKKTAVEDCLRIDINRWAREGILTVGTCTLGTWRWTYASGKGFAVHYEVNALNLDEASLRLSYQWVWTASAEPESAAYRVRLTTTRPRFGGVRWWFLCPLSVNGRACGRRVGKLYLPQPARYFGCRKCYNLTYTSCQESHKYDSLDRLLACRTGTDPSTMRGLRRRLKKGQG